MNLNFPPIVSQEILIDTSVGSATAHAGTFRYLVDRVSAGAANNLAPYPKQGWLRDIDHECAVGGDPRPVHFDLPNLGNEGEILSIMAWLGDQQTWNADGSAPVGGQFTESCFKHMIMFIGSYNFNNIPLHSPSGAGGAFADPLHYPGSTSYTFHGPMPTDIFYESAVLYPNFTESVDSGVTPQLPGTRTPFLQENFSTPIPYIRGSKGWNQGALGMGIVWKFWDEGIGGPVSPRSIIKIKITARRFR